MPGRRRNRLQNVEEEVDSVRRWLSDIQLVTVAEPIRMEVKSISSSIPVSSTERNEAATVKDTIYRIQGLAGKVFKQCSVILQKLRCSTPESLSSDVYLLRNHAQACLKECCLVLPKLASSPDLHEITSLIERLVDIFELHEDLADQLDVDQLLQSLGSSVRTLIKPVQASLIRKLVVMITGSASEVKLKFALVTVYGLAKDSIWLRRLLLEEEAMRALFAVCRMAGLSICSIPTTSLQVISTLCTETEGRKEFEKLGGVGVLVELLASPSTTESTLQEAVTMLAELTSPDIAKYSCMFLLIEHMADLLRHLTAVCEKTNNTTVFMAAVSTIANITFLDTMSSDYLAEFNTGKVLIVCCRKEKAPSLYSQHQVVTIIANMCGSRSCRQQILDAGGIQFLSDLLHARPARARGRRSSLDSGFSASTYCSSPDYNRNHDLSPSGSPGSDSAGSVGSTSPTGSPGAALDRCIMGISHRDIHQKAAIALGRLCHDYESSMMAVNCNVVSRLVELCRDPKQKNESFILASLGALRKIHSQVGGAGIFQPRDEEQLIQPSLIKSYHMCCITTKRETFV